MKIETIDRVCLIAVKSKENNMICLNSIKEELAKKSVKTFYSSASNLFGKDEFVHIAISENDLCVFLDVMGKAREKAFVTSYSICASNTIITIQKKDFSPFSDLENMQQDIKLISDDGLHICIVCESSKKHFVLASLNSEK